MPNKPVFTTFHGYEGNFPPAKKSIIIRKISEKLSSGNICVGKYIEKWYSTKADLITYGAIETPSRIPQPQTNTGITCYYRSPQDQQFAVYSPAFKSLRLQNHCLTIDIYGRPQSPDHTPGSSFHGIVTQPKNLFLKNKYAFVSGYLSILEALAYKRLVFSIYTNPIEKDYLTMSPFAKYISICDSPNSLIQKFNYYLNHPQAEQKTIKHKVTSS